MKFLTRWGWRLLGLTKEQSNKIMDTSPPKFVIKYYPRTKKYVVEYKYGWLKSEFSTGIVRIEHLFDIVTFSSTEKEARELIELYKEQNFNEGVLTIAEI